MSIEDVSEDLVVLLMKTRIISAIIMLMIFIPLIIIGKLPFVLMVSILGLLALKEILQLEREIPNFLKFSASFFVLFLVLYNYQDTTIAFILNVKYLVLLCLFYFSGVVILGDLKKYNYKDAIFIIMMVLLIGFSFNNFIIIRNLGVLEFIYLLLIATLTDTFAFLVGKYLGKHKLSKISPNKTIEGSIGGSLLGTIITVLIYVSFSGLWNKLFIIIGVTFILSILGQIGDLFFSSIKRYYGIKDFSNLIKGHGGILDRLDSLIFISLGYILILM